MVVLQVLSHEIVVIQEEHHMYLRTEMGDWVDNGCIDDAPEEEQAAASIGPSNMERVAGPLPLRIESYQL